MTILQPILKGILIGLGAAMPLGPVNVEIARRTLRSGFLTGVCLGAGACSIDVMYAILTTLSVGRFLDVKLIYWPLSVGAIILLSYLGVMCLKSAWQNRIISDEAPKPNSPRQKDLFRSYTTGLLMTLLNPMTIAFWFVALPGIAGQLQQSALPYICIGVFLGTISWVLSFSGCLSLLGRFKRNTWMRAADAFGGITLLGFAITVMWHAANGHR